MSDQSEAGIKAEVLFPSIAEKYTHLTAFDMLVVLLVLFLFDNLLGYTAALSNRHRRLS